MRFAAITIAALVIIVCAAGVEARVELKPVPVQNELASNISMIAPTHLMSTGVMADSEVDAFGQPLEKKKKVSVAKAALLSALLPGLGERYVGHHNKARYFFGAEAVTWIGFFAFRTYGAWKKDDLIRFAGEKANANLTGKDDEFLDWVGFYRSIDDFNTLGRVSDPDRPYLEDTPENHWVWQSDADREAYRELKNSSREAYRRSDFMIGVAIVNRVISIIDAIRDARRANSRLDDSFSQGGKPRYRFTIDPLSDRQLKLTIFTPF